MIHELEYDGYNLEVVGDYEKGEPEERNYPGSPAIFKITGVYDYKGDENEDIQDRFDLPSLSQEIINRYYED